jgi:hypothetical protein
MFSLLVILRKKGDEVTIAKCVGFCRRAEYMPWWVVATHEYGDEWFARVPSWNSAPVQLCSFVHIAVIKA